MSNDPFFSCAPNVCGPDMGRKGLMDDKDPFLGFGFGFNAPSLPSDGDESPRKLSPDHK